MKNIKKEKRGFFAFVPLWALILFGVGGIAFIVQLISKQSVALSDFITNTTGKLFRALLSCAFRGRGSTCGCEDFSV